MKKLAAILFSAAILLCAGTGVFAEDTNIAIGTDGVVSSSATDAQPATSAFDGDIGTYWQAANNAAGEFVGKTFDKTYGLSSVVVVWGGGNVDLANYELQVTVDGGETWTKVDVAGTRESPRNVEHRDTFTFANKLKADGVRVYCNAGSGKNSIQMWELEVYGSEWTAEDEENVSTAPSEAPSETPSEAPSEAPSQAPSETPSQAPSQAPAESTVSEPAPAADGGISPIALVAIFVAVAVAVGGVVFFIVKGKK